MQHQLGMQGCWIRALRMQRSQGSKTSSKDCRSMGGRKDAGSNHAMQGKQAPQAQEAASMGTPDAGSRAMRDEVARKKKQARMHHQWGRKDAWIQSHADAR
eukprot:gene13010-3513_t